MSSSAAGTPSPTPSSSPVAGTPTVGQLKALDTFSPLVEDRLRNSMLPVLSDEGKKKKRRAPGDENDDPADSTPATYRWTGRNLARSVGPYVRIHTIVEHGVAMALADSDDESPAETVEEKRLTESWNIIKDTIPGFAEEMIGLGGNRILRKQVCTEIQEGVRGARGDDSSALKRSAPDYLELPAAPTTEDGSATVPAPPALPAPKIKAGGNKVDRGYENPATARAILPVKHQPTAETFARIRAGDIIVLGTELPYLLYRDGYEYNEDDREDGLLEGHTLFACAKHIYQGPSAALKAPGYNRGKAGNAALNGVTALTRRDIAYVACQSRFALSSQQHWGVADGTFSYLDFSGPSSTSSGARKAKRSLTRAVPIIDRFNFAVFGTKPAAKKTIAAVQGPTDFEVLEAQRAAKRARKIAAAAAAATAAAAPAHAPAPAPAA